MTPREADELRRQLRACGLRATPARITILQLLRATRIALSHSEVVDALGGDAHHDRATTHRALTQLTHARLLRRMDMGDRVWRFAAIDAKAGDPHVEFVCDICGGIQRLPHARLDVLGRGPRAITDGAIIVRVHGCCDACRRTS